MRDKKFEDLLRKTNEHISSGNVFMADKCYELLSAQYNKLRSKKRYESQFRRISIKIRRFEKSTFALPFVNLDSLKKRVSLETGLFVIMAFAMTFLIFSDGGITGFSTVDVEEVKEEVVEEPVVEGIVEEELEEIIGYVKEEPVREGRYVEITYFYCALVKDEYEICIDVDWNDGSYAKGLIIGGKPLIQIDKEYERPFTYCQTFENGGNKALHAYLYDENDKILTRDIGKKVRCGE